VLLAEDYRKQRMSIPQYAVMNMLTLEEGGTGQVEAKEHHQAAFQAFPAFPADQASQVEALA
jgi:hypothetical protein